MKVTHAILVLAVALAACSGDDDGDNVAQQPRVEVQIDLAGGVTFLVDGRETLSTAGTAPELRTFSVITRSLVGHWEFSREDEVVTPLAVVNDIRQTSDRAEIDFASADGSARATLTVTHPDPGRTSLMRLAVAAGPGVGNPSAVSSLALPLRCDAESEFHGFGGQYGKTDQRGEAFRLFVSEQGLGRKPDQPIIPINGSPYTTYFPMPYFVDPRGFGALVRTDQRVQVDLCKSNPDAAWFEVISGEPLEMLVFHGPTAANVIEQLGSEVGRPKAPPEWAYDLWIGAQAGTTETVLGAGSAAIRAEVEALRGADIPVGALWVQDWSGIRVNFDGGSGVQYRWEADDVLYPDLADMIAEFRADGIRFLSYANPFIDRDRGFRFYREMNERGFLIHNPAGETYDFLAPNGNSSLPDLTNPDAREYVKSYLRKMVVDYGMDGWMADFGEWAPTDAVYFDGSDPVARHNLYPVDWSSIQREVMDEVRPDGDWAVFARSGFTGVHEYSMIHWIGDQETDWSETDGLPTVVPAMLNLSLSGIPFVTHDIAGFSGTIAPASTKELYQRWTELGAFTPIMRTHEGARKQLNWSWEKDDETTSHFRRFARIHASLKPDLIELAATAAKTSMPIVRHLMLEFPEDARSHEISDQFMLGSDLLVAPVITEGATDKTLYLPPGHWYHVWSGDMYTGGGDITIAAPIGEPPVFSRERDRPDLRSID